MLILSRRSGESLMIGDGIEIKVVELAGDQVKIGISAPRECRIMRKELCQTRESNIEAAQSAAPRAAVLSLLAQYGNEGSEHKD